MFFEISDLIGQEIGEIGELEFMQNWAQILGGRDKFFIHGGSIKGSAGCIDVGGGLTGDQGTDKLLNIISSSLINIDLEVVE